MDEDDFGYGKDQYTEADIENILKTDYSKQKKAKDRATESEQQETKNALLIQSILSTALPVPISHPSRWPLKSLPRPNLPGTQMRRLLGNPQMPATVSVNCWHVCCEECWLRTLGTKGCVRIARLSLIHATLRKVFFWDLNVFLDLINCVCKSKFKYMCKC